MFKFSKSKHIDLAMAYKSARNILNEIPAVKARKRKNLFIKTVMYVSYGVLALFFIALAVGGAHAVGLAEIYKEAKSGKYNLEQAMLLAETQDFKQAFILAGKAKDDFAAAISGLEEEKNGFFISRAPFLKSQLEDAEHLLIAAEILSRAAGNGIDFAMGLENLLEGDKKLSFSKFSREEKRKILGRIYEAEPEIIGMRATLNLSFLNLQKVRANGLLIPFRGKIADLKVKLAEVDKLLARAVPMSRILPALAGYPEKAAFLVLLQNSDELRPTGGFLGTYGILEIEYGEIIRFDTHDIYHMDMPVEDKLDIMPPAPIKKYLVPKWFMRDANWSPDWPTAAQKIEWFYKLEDGLLPPKDKINNFGGEFKGVIAVTPKFITDLIALTGPIKIGEDEFNRDNFVNLLEYKVEKGYVQLGVPSWHRKEIIGDIAKEIKIRLLDMPSSRWREAADVIIDNMTEKNILVFFKDAETENLIKEQGAGGEMKDSGAESDYFMVVDANMGALKTDAIMSRGIDYEIEEKKDGLFVKLLINYSHNGKPDWKTTTYKSYTRVYVPLGSQLIRAGGASEPEITAQNEAGKTFFGAFITVEPGQIRTLRLEYKLPAYLFTAAKSGSYVLYAQKQPGNNVNKLSVDVKLADTIKLYNPVGFYAQRIGAGEIKWEGDLRTDKKFEVYSVK